jgi:pimeloyl-ACP methyl ester carboxylesterase
MPEISAGELTIAYEIQGEGPPLLMCHGGEGDRHSDDHFKPRLEDQFTIITFDQRDSGETRGSDREYDFFEHAHDAANLLSALGYDKAFVYGQSYGGMVAQSIAIAHPEKVERLIVAVTTPGKRRRDDRSAEVVALLKASTDGAPPPPLPQGRFFAPGAYERRPELQTMMQKFVERRKVAVTEVERLRRRALAAEGFDSLDQLSSIRAPTLVLGAWGDQVLNPASSFAIAERIPNARLIILEAVGHALTWEAPERVAPIIRGFLTE